MFASLDQLLFYKTSRKDDLIQLAYLLHYLLFKGQFAPYMNDKSISRLENLRGCQRLK